LATACKSNVVCSRGVRRQPEAFPQAMLKKEDGCSNGYTAARSSYWNLALLEMTRKATCLIRQACITALKRESREVMPQGTVRTERSVRLLRDFHRRISTKGFDVAPITLHERTALGGPFHLSSSDGEPRHGYDDALVEEILPCAKKIR
jgi:hypothetical protein